MQGQGGGGKGGEPRSRIIVRVVEISSRGVSMGRETDSALNLT